MLVYTELRNMVVRNMVVTTNYKYAYSLLNYYIAMTKNNSKSFFPIFSHFEARSAYLKQTTTSKRFLFAREIRLKATLQA